MVEAAALCAGAQAAATTMELEGKPVAMLVQANAQTEVGGQFAVMGRSGVEEVYGVPYLDVGCDVWFDVCRVHHFSPLITAIRRRPYQPRLSLSIPLPQHLDRPRGH